jgi:hypothetical protein
MAKKNFAVLSSTVINGKPFAAGSIVVLEEKDAKDYDGVHESKAQCEHYAKEYGSKPIDPFAKEGKKESEQAE